MPHYLNNGAQTLNFLVQKALAIGATDCYILMRQGIGVMALAGGQQIIKLNTISPAVFADCHAFIMQCLPQTATVGNISSGLITIPGPQGPVQVMVRSYLHLEPSITLSFNRNYPLPLSLAELSMAGPTTLAIRQFLATQQRTLLSLSHFPPQNQPLLTQALHGVLGLFARSPTLHIGASPRLVAGDIQVAPELPVAYKASPSWSQALVLADNFNPALATTLATEPLPKKLLLGDGNPGVLTQAMEHAQSVLAFSTDEAALLPALVLYIQALPRLCSVCRIPIRLNADEYYWLQTQLSGNIYVNYTVTDRTPGGPVTKQPITRLEDAGIGSLLNQIAHDPTIVNRSASVKRPAQAPPVVTVWQAAQRPDCPVCQGSGFDGYLLVSGFAELGNLPTSSNSAEMYAAKNEQLVGRFWTDFFDTVEDGMIAISQVAGMAAPAARPEPTHNPTLS